MSKLLNKEQIKKIILSENPIYNDLLSKCNIKKEEIVEELLNKDNKFFIILKSSELNPDEKLIKLYLIFKINIHIRTKFDSYYLGNVPNFDETFKKLDLYILSELYKRFIDDTIKPPFSIAQIKEQIKIIMQIKPIPDIDDLDALILSYDISDYCEYREYISQFGYLTKKNSLTINITFVDNGKPTPAKQTTYPINFIIFLLTICYLIGLNYSAALHILHRFVEYDDNERYYIDHLSLKYIDDLLKIDKQISSYSQFKSHPLMIELVDIQGTVLIKKIQKPNPSTTPTLKRGEISIFRPLTVLHITEKHPHYHLKRTVESVIASRGSPSIPGYIGSVKDGQGRSKYLNYKVKYLLLKKLMNI